VGDTQCKILWHISNILGVLPLNIGTKACKDITIGRNVQKVPFVIFWSLYDAMKGLADCRHADKVLGVQLGENMYEHFMRQDLQYARL
jgi:hypothetical protein